MMVDKMGRRTGSGHFGGDVVGTAIHSGQC